MQKNPKKRTSVIRRKTVMGKNKDHEGPDTIYVVDLWEGDTLIEARELPGKNSYYAKDVAENWENGIIQISE